MKNQTFVVGVDEVGRGPLAGPICFGFVKVSFEEYKKLKKDKNLPKKGIDSKKLKKIDREVYEKYLRKLKKQKVLDFYITNFSNKEIDKNGLSFVIKKSIEKGLNKIKAKSSDKILFDGGLKTDPKIFPNQKAIIKGDEKEKVIAWASIIAKVYRDNLMQKMAKKYPEYGFDSNVGYGTKWHINVIKKFGKTSIHRQSFFR